AVGTTPDTAAPRARAAHRGTSSVLATVPSFLALKLEPVLLDYGDAGEPQGTAGLAEAAPHAQPGPHSPAAAPTAVDLGVVRQDPQDLHAVLLAEPGHRPVQNPRTGGVTLVGQRLDVGHARVVIDRDV